MLIIFPVILMTVIVLTAVLPATSHSVSAALIVTSDFNYDNTSVEDDLADYDFASFFVEHPFGVGDPEIFEFVEYCYSDNSNASYGLYLYLYNPQGKDISLSTNANTVNMAVTYDLDKDGEDPSFGSPGQESYRDVGLTFLNFSTDENGNHYFYKFKITDTTQIYKTEQEYNIKMGYRRYDIAGIQLRPYGGSTSTVHDYKVGGIWLYEGYAKGCDASAMDNSTLSVKRDDLTTLDLDVKSTFFRPDGFCTQNSALGLYDQLDSVYFRVPNEYFEQYGKIAGISASWYEKRTKPILVIGDVYYDQKKNEWSEYGKAYNYFQSQMLGKNISSLYDDKHGWSSSSVDYSFAAGLYAKDSGFFNSALATALMLGLNWIVWCNVFTCSYCYNMKSNWVNPQPERLDTLYNVIGVEGDVMDYTISGQQLVALWEDYTDSHNNSTKNDWGYAEELFTDDVNLFDIIANTPKSEYDVAKELDGGYAVKNLKEVEHKAGYNSVYVPADYEVDLAGYEYNKAWYNYIIPSCTWTRKDFSTKKAIEVYADAAKKWKLPEADDEDTELPYTFVPFDQLVSWDENNTKDEVEVRNFCEGNYIDYSTFGEFADEVETARKQDESIVMFRFAQSVYQALPVRIYHQKDSGNWMSEIDDSNGHAENAYLASENVYLGFDVISVTFCKEGNYVTIPVVADPIDVVAGLTSPELYRGGDSCTGAFVTVLMIIAVIIFAFLLFKVIGWFIKRNKVSTNVTINMSDLMDDSGKTKTKKKNKK